LIADRKADREDHKTFASVNISKTVADRAKVTIND